MAYSVKTGMAPAACAAPANRATVLVTLPAGKASSSQNDAGVLAMVVNSGIGGAAFLAASMAEEIGST